jgi:hypothetical protein
MFLSIVAFFGLLRALRARSAPGYLSGISTATGSMFQMRVAYSWIERSELK